MLSVDACPNALPNTGAPLVKGVGLGAPPNGEENAVPVVPVAKGLASTLPNEGLGSGSVTAATGLFSGRHFCTSVS